IDVFNLYVLSFDVTDFSQSSTESGHEWRSRASSRSVEGADYGIAFCCARTGSEDRVASAVAARRTRRLIWEPYHAIREAQPASLTAANVLSWPLADVAGYSITSSARNVGGTVTPRRFAVPELTIRMNLLACSIGRSPGFSPRRILAT